MSGRLAFNALEHYGLEGLLRLSAETEADWIAALKDPSFAGFCIAKPLTSEALRFCEEAPVVCIAAQSQSAAGERLIARLSPAASQTGFVDAIIRESDGSLTGDSGAPDAILNTLEALFESAAAGSRSLKGLGAAILIDDFESPEALASLECARMLDFDVRLLLFGRTAKFQWADFERRVEAAHGEDGLPYAVRMIIIESKIQAEFAGGHGLKQASKHVLFCSGDFLRQHAAADAEETLRSFMTGTKLLVNASSLGRSPHMLAMSAAVDRILGSFAESFKACGEESAKPGVLDLVDNPLRTYFLQKARALGMLAKGGQDARLAWSRVMLQSFLGRTLSPSLTATVEDEIRRSEENIILIGMPGCGKTTIGKVLAHRLKRRFIDIDELVVKRVGKPKARIYLEDGEEYFRNIESAVICEAASQHGLVISTGGGSCLREENARRLSMNGRFVWLKRPLARLSTKDRPIPQRRGVTALYEERAPIYEKLADCEISVTTIEETIAELMCSKNLAKKLTTAAVSRQH